jgi:hypothetical protein
MLLLQCIKGLPLLLPAVEIKTPLISKNFPILYSQRFYDPTKMFDSNDRYNSRHPGNFLGALVLGCFLFVQRGAASPHASLSPYSPHFPYSPLSPESTFPPTFPPTPGSTSPQDSNGFEESSSQARRSLEKLKSGGLENFSIKDFDSFLGSVAHCIKLHREASGGFREALEREKNGVQAPIDAVEEK